MRRAKRAYSVGERGVWRDRWGSRMPPGKGKDTNDQKMNWSTIWQGGITLWGEEK